MKELRNPENPIIKEISETFVKYQPDVVGVTVMTPKAASAFTIASLAKKIQQKIVMLSLVNPHAALRAEEILKNTKDVDFVVNGEAKQYCLNW